MLIRSCSSVANVNHHRGSGRISSHNCASGENAAAMFARLRSHEAFGMALIAGTVMLLTGCGVADQYSALPKVFREPGVEPPPPEPEPDVKELVRVGADTLFMGHPSALEVSRPRRIAGRRFDVCVRAVVPGAVDGEPRPVTVLVTIEHGKLADRHRATAQDRCARDTYEPVKP
jgi:hypothetical protein